MDPRRLASAAALVALAGSLGACSSQRFGSDALAATRPPRGVATGPSVLEPVAPALPSGPITASPLAPPPGATAAADPGPLGAGIAASPGAVIAEPPPAAPPVQQQASIAPAPPVTSGGRSSVVGSWTAKDATGATCRVQLSSAPALDLYKASAAGCANKDLGRVTAWDYRDGEVYLYQPGGTVAARLRSGGGALDGVLSKSGAPLALAR